MVRRFNCYVDESGTDSDSPTAVVGGLLLNDSDFFWLDVEWKKALARHGITPPIHMREFGKHQRFGSITGTARRALFTDLVQVVNAYKLYSVAATLTSELYRLVFDGVSAFSMYGACFAQLVMINDILTPKNKGPFVISYILDDGNPYRGDILEAYPIMKSTQKTLDTVEFRKDESLNALQAADMVCWGVRRRLAGTFPFGYEPLQELFGEGHHIDVPYKEEWMRGVADTLRTSGACG